MLTRTLVGRRAEDEGRPPEVLADEEAEARPPEILADENEVGRRAEGKGRPLEVLAGEEAEARPPEVLASKNEVGARCFVKFNRPKRKKAYFKPERLRLELKKCSTFGQC